MLADWRERDFERWFQSHSRLPGDEPILLITRQRPIRRVVDLVGIDSKGGLVILEVKNESTSRRAIGQALEYLSHYEEISLPALAEEYEEETGRSLLEDFQERFGQRLLAVSTRRRVYLVGPSHDAYAAVCADYLSRHLGAAGVEVQLVVAQRADAGFQVSLYRAEGLRRASDLPAGFAVSPRHHLFQIIAPGPQAILWHIGWLDPATHQLRLRKTVSRRTLRPSQRLLMPCEVPAGVRTDNAGAVYAHRTRRGRKAKVIGYVSTQGDTAATYAFVAVFDDEVGFRCFQRIPSKGLERDWSPSERELPDWRATAQFAQELHLRRRGRRNPMPPVA
jgi:hypothetical protein